MIRSWWYATEQKTRATLAAANRDLGPRCLKLSDRLLRPRSAADDDDDGGDGHALALAASDSDPAVQATWRHEWAASQVPGHSAELR